MITTKCKRLKIHFVLLVKLAAAIFLLLAVACSDKSKSLKQPNSIPNPVTQSTDKISLTQLAATNKVWPKGETLLNNAAVNAEMLNAEVNELLKEPSIDSLTQTQDTWKKTAESIEQFYILSRLGVAETKNFEILLEGHFNIAAWPIEPGYLDAYGEHSYSGIVFDISTAITESVLREQHGLTDKSDVALGIYAIEFLLFGENNKRYFLELQETKELTAKTIDEGYQTKEELPNNRRRELLRLQSALLTKDIAKLRTEWSNQSPIGLSAHFEKRSKESHQLLMTQITQTTLTEQILAIAELQKRVPAQPPESNQWQSQELSRRISAQLTGISIILALSSEAELQAIKQPAKTCADLISQIELFPINTAETKTNTLSWKNAYECIRDLVNKLEPTATKVK